MDQYFYGTQYYRSPTPLENEWDFDLKNLGKFNLNIIQIRINWRNNERAENQYNFDDVDKLLVSAKKNNKKVVIKFLLECAPQYIFDKYEGTRIGPKGEQIRGGYHGAFYGGWMPCFTNQNVLERACLFVKKVVERYKDNTSIIMWNAWNEPRNKPVEDCFCKSCRKEFGIYLKNKYKTIENLNSFYGASEESFENINLPSMPHGYWDIYEFKMFKSSFDIKRRLQAVYDTIRSIDKDRPVISHSGYASAFQSNLGDCLDDRTVRESVDKWGTSLPMDTNMSVLENRLDFNMLLDYLRSVDKDFYLYEIYPGLGMYRYTYDTQFDMEYKLYTGLFGGSKGFNFWQYRSERVGHENDCAGLARSDGTPREVLKPVASFGEFLKSFGNPSKISKIPAETAILFDYESLLMSEIDDCSGVDYSFNQFWNVEYYKKSHAGFYRLMKRNNFSVDYVNTKDVENIYKYKVLYVPYYPMIDEKVEKALAEFVKNGGVLLLDEGFGLRTKNTWVNPYYIECKDLYEGKINERRFVRENVEIAGKNLIFSGYKSEIAIKNAEKIDLSNNLNYYKLENIYTFGFSFGYTCYSDSQNAMKFALDVLGITKLIKPLQYSDFKNEIESSELNCDGVKKTLIYNLSNEEKAINNIKVDSKSFKII